MHVGGNGLHGFHLLFAEGRVDLVVEKDDPADQGLACFQVRLDGVAVEELGHVMGDLFVRNKERQVLDQVVVLAFDDLVGVNRIGMGHGMQEEPEMRAPYFWPETDAGNDVLLAHKGAGEKRGSRMSLKPFHEAISDVVPRF